jgi:hypothetical protein
MRSPKVISVDLTDRERLGLDAWARRRTTAQAATRIALQRPRGVLVRRPDQTEALHSAHCSVTGSGADIRKSINE